MSRDQMNCLVVFQLSPALQLYILTSMADEDLPLGYLVSDDVLREYTKTLTDRAMSDRHIRVHAMFMSLTRANAIVSGAHWVTSDVYEGIQLARFLQISGGGPNEWRVSKDVEEKLCKELGLTDKPVRFKPQIQE